MNGRFSSMKSEKKVQPVADEHFPAREGNLSRVNRHDIARTAVHRTTFPVPGNSPSLSAENVHAVIGP